MKELAVIAGIRSLLPSPRRDCVPRLTDDCGIVSDHRRPLLATTDMLIDSIHFDTTTMSLDKIGRKAVCVNLSDLASSGATPTELLVSIALPKAWSTAESLRLMDCIISTATEFGCSILGGDTNHTRGPLTICITALGESHWRGPVVRSGARDGDLLMVTGTLGGSFPSGRHLSFTPRLKESQWLLDHFPVNAMMDVSDGLATDVRHLAEASNLSVVVDELSVPIHPDCGGTYDERLVCAFCDGEDFELLFAVSPEYSQKILKTFPWPCGVRNIGHFQKSSSKVWLKTPDGRTVEMPYKGFEHGL